MIPFLRSSGYNVKKGMEDHTPEYFMEKSFERNAFLLHVKIASKDTCLHL